MNILIADDEKNIRNSLASTFKLEGYQVETAEDGAAAVEAVEKALQGRPDDRWQTADAMRRAIRDAARDAGLEMLWRSQGEFRAPPPETVFLHRKLVGSFLLCAKIKARVNVQGLISAHL